MDYLNLETLRVRAGQGFAGELGLFLEYANLSVEEVPDPYYGGPSGFERVLDLVEEASRGLLKTLRQRHSF